MDLFEYTFNGGTHLEAKHQCPDDIGAGDMVEAIPQDAGDVFLGGEEEAVERRVRGRLRVRVRQGYWGVRGRG